MSARATTDKEARGGAASATPGQPTQHLTERPVKHMGNTDEVDPRVAATGGRRRIPGDPKSNSEWPGMMPLPAWSRTRVHEHSTYFCGKCGARLGSPQAVYTHLAKRHPATTSRPRPARLTPPEASARGNGRVRPQTQPRAVTSAP